MTRTSDTEAQPAASAAATTTATATATTAQAAASGNLRGIVAMVAAVGFFSLMDALLKTLSASYPAMQVAALRGWAALPLVAVYVLWRGEVRGLLKVRWPLHLLRGVLNVTMFRPFPADLVTRLLCGKKGVTVEYEAGDESHVLECDKLIVSVGRVPNTDGLGCESVGLQLDERGRIKVDDHCRSNLPNVWAVGDVVRGPMLAHKGMEEGVMVAELIAGQAGHCNYDAVPWVIYTHPEIAWVGKTEQQLKSAGIAYRAGQIPFAANGRALGQGDTTGFVKMLADARTDRILGVHIIGTNASELISEAVVAMEFHASSEDIARIVHAHPTLSEVMHEAALSVDKRPLHF